ncbi:MAG: hypothetical protein WBA57_23195 [Elainellaceae cyanobacterium]
MQSTEIDCSVACVNGCVLGEKCPNLEYKAQASEFIESTSLDDMLAIAEEAIRKKMTEPPKWVFPEDGVSKGDES